MRNIYQYSLKNKNKADFYLVGSSTRGEDNFNDYDIVIHPKKRDINEYKFLVENCPKKETDGKRIDCNLIEDIQNYLNKSTTKILRYNIRNNNFNSEYCNIHSKKHLTKGLQNLSKIYYRKIV